MDKRYQIFISPTFVDLQDERQSVLRAILELDHMPAGMELFPATDDSSFLINMNGRAEALSRISNVQQQSG
jgi:hypothetical protein